MQILINFRYDYPSQVCSYTQDRGLRSPTPIVHAPLSLDSHGTWARDFSLSASILIRNNDDETLLWRLEGGAVKPGDKDTCWAGCSRVLACVSPLRASTARRAQILLLSVVKFITATLRRGVGRGWIHCRCLVSRPLLAERCSPLPGVQLPQPPGASVVLAKWVLCFHCLTAIIKLQFLRNSKHVPFGWLLMREGVEVCLSRPQGNIEESNIESETRGYL